MKTTKGYRIGVVEGTQLRRISAKDLSLSEAARGIRIFNEISHGSTRHAVIVQPISEAILKAKAILRATPTSKSA